MSDTNYILTSDNVLISENELYHYGVLGMKWGIRRYQNKDGSLTLAGKKRVRNSGDLGFPAYDRKRKRYSDPVKNRLAVGNKLDDEYIKTVKNERDRLLNDKETLKKSGYIFDKNPDSDTREHNDDILSYLVSKSPSVQSAYHDSAERFLDMYADATIADLGLRNTESAKNFVKDYLRETSSYFRRQSMEENNKHA